MLGLLGLVSGCASGPVAASHREQRVFATMFQASADQLAGRFAEAERGYREVLAAEPDAHRARLRLAEVLIELARSREAVYELTRAYTGARVADVAPDVRRRAAEVAASSGWWPLAGAMLASEEPEQLRDWADLVEPVAAALSLAGVEELVSPLVAGLPEAGAARLAERARGWLLREDRLGAAALALDALARHHDRPAVWRAVGDLRLAQGRLDDALDAWELIEAPDDGLARRLAAWRARRGALTRPNER